MILIVDDHHDTCAILERLLRGTGFDAASATGGAEAIAMLHLHKPSLVILDLNMPEMDGLTVLQKIKEHDDLKHIRVLIYSADTHLETMIAAKRLGAEDFLVKGRVAFDNLVARICDLASDRSSLH